MYFERRPDLPRHPATHQRRSHDHPEQLKALRGAQGHAESRQALQSGGLPGCCGGAPLHDDGRVVRHHL
eukprot:9104596-Heterocapsa_arctica.AAC.1